jgi:hypothetical protein
MDGDGVGNVWPPNAPPSARGADMCKPQGLAWTCTIQCDPGTRYSIERQFNAPGVEICAVTQCHCEQMPSLPGAAPTASVQDIFGIPLAAVIFGLEHLVRGRP